MIKETQIVKYGRAYSVFDDADCDTVKCVMHSWSEHDQYWPKNPRLILDLGANVGCWAFAAATQYPKCEVIAVEPLERNYKHLMDGIAFNKLDNVGTLRLAVSNDKEVELRYPTVNKGAASCHIPDSPHYVIEKAKGINLTELVNLWSVPINLMKIDIEGAEYQIFEDFSDWQKIHALTIEFHPWPQFEGAALQKEKTDALIKKIRSNMGIKPVKFTYPQFHDRNFLTGL